MASESVRDTLLHFRATPALRTRLEAAKPLIAKREDVRLEQVTVQLLLSRLLRLALETLGVPQPDDDGDAQ